MGENSPLQQFCLITCHLILSPTIGLVYLSNIMQRELCRLAGLIKSLAHKERRKERRKRKKKNTWFRHKRYYQSLYMSVVHLQLKCKFGSNKALSTLLSIWSLKKQIYAGITGEIFWYFLYSCSEIWSFSSGLHSLFCCPIHPHTSTSLNEINDNNCQYCLML